MSKQSQQPKLSKPMDSATPSPIRESAKSSAYWGMRTQDFYRALANKSIKITALDGKLYSGTLIGVDQYDLVIRQVNGLTILFPKHAIKYLHGDATPPSASEV
jgi:hypothetical protein